MVSWAIYLFYHNCIINGCLKTKLDFEEITKFDIQSERSSGNQVETMLEGLTIIYVIVKKEKSLGTLEKENFQEKPSPASASVVTRWRYI